LLGAFALGVLLTPVARSFAVRWNVVDHPVGDKIHRVSTPLLGGVAVYLTFAIASLVLLPLSAPVVGILAGGFVAVAIGILDEVLTLRPLVHLAGQVAAALVGIMAGVGVVANISDPVSALTSPGWAVPVWLGLPITVFWIVGMMNTMNFLDGMDGLAAGVAALTTLVLAVWASEPQRFYITSTTHLEQVILPVSLAGALLAFLVFNWHPARIFLGDSGSMFLGFSLGALSIVGPAKLGTALLVLVIPILDVAWAIVRRRMRGRSFLTGDKQHVYHRMLELGLSHTTTVLLLYFLCLALAGMDLLLFKVAKLVAFVLLALVTGTTFVVLEVRATRRNAALVSRQAVGR